jgi:hypothetical protein
MREYRRRGSVADFFVWPPDMSLINRVNETLSQWQNEDIRRRDGSLPVWDLGGPGLFARHRRRRRESVAACRRQLLTIMFGADRPVFLMPPGPPEEYEIPGHWQPAGNGTWLVPPDFKLDDPAVKYWLFTLGDWRLYCAPAPVERKSPDAFRCRAAELLAWMESNAVQALIESFHDDTEWVVAVSTN